MELVSLVLKYVYELLHVLACKRRLGKYLKLQEASLLSVIEKICLKYVFCALRLFNFLNYLG